MDRDEFMELVYETFTDEPDNVLANGIIEAADAYVEYEKAQLSQEGTIKDATSDTISRQMAIDELPYLLDYDGLKGENGFVSKRLVRKMLKELPPAQPEEHTEKRTETHACDSIGRQVAIDAVDAIGHIATMPDGDKCIRSSAVKYTLSMLPPEQPERKKGKWIQNDNGTYSCSLCNSWIPEEQHYYAQFCLYCGADMRGETE